MSSAHYGNDEQESAHIDEEEEEALEADIGYAMLLPADETEEENAGEQKIGRASCRERVCHRV